MFSGKDVEIKNAHPEDSCVIARFLIEAWLEAYEDIVPAVYTRGLSLTEWEADWYLHLQSAEVFVCVEDNCIMGILEISQFGESKQGTEQCGEFPLLYIAPNKLRSGYGTLLMEFGIQKAKEMGYVAVVVWVLEKNIGAMKFYQKMGFLSTAIVEKYGSTHLDKILLKKLWLQMDIRLYVVHFFYLKITVFFSTDGNHSQ